MNRMSLVVSRVLQRLSRAAGPLMSLLLSGGTHRLMSSQLLIVRFTGRRTGRTFATPVSYVQEGSELLIPGGGKWWKNLVSGQAMVRLRGSWMPVSGSDVIDQPDEMSKVLGRMMAANPALSVFTGIRRGPDGQPDSKSLERELSRGFVIVRLVLQNHAGAEILERSAVA